MHDTARQLIAAPQRLQNGNVVVPLRGTHYERTVICFAEAGCAPPDEHRFHADPSGELDNRLGNALYVGEDQPSIPVGNARGAQIARKLAGRFPASRIEEVRQLRFASSRSHWTLERRLRRWIQPIALPFVGVGRQGNAATTLAGVVEAPVRSDARNP